MVMPSPRSIWSVPTLSCSRRRANFTSLIQSSCVSIKLNRWNLGDGNDTINDYNATDRDNIEHEDRLIFGEGISLDNLSWSRSSDNLIATVSSTDESITINNYFTADSYRVERIELSDGTILDKSEIEFEANTITASTSGGYLYGNSSNDMMIGLDGVDRIYSGLGDDRLFGGSGNDYLYGEDGSDELNGELGNDTLSGGEGDDLYLFNTGDGADTLNNFDTDSSFDIARFNGIEIDDLWFAKSGNDLLLIVAGSDDQVTIPNWYYSTNYQLDAIEVGSSVLLNAQIDQLVSAMASFDIPAGIGSVTPQDVKDQLQPMLLESWKNI